MADLVAVAAPTVDSAPLLVAALVVRVSLVRLVVDLVRVVARVVEDLAVADQAADSGRHRARVGLDRHLVLQAALGPLVVVVVSVAVAVVPAHSEVAARARQVRAVLVLVRRRAPVERRRSAAAVALVPPVDLEAVPVVDSVEPAAAVSVVEGRVADSGQRLHHHPVSRVPKHQVLLIIPLVILAKNSVKSFTVPCATLCIRIRVVCHMGLFR